MATWWCRDLRLVLGLGLFLLLVSYGCQDPFTQSPLVGVILWNQEIQSFEENLQGIFEGLREEGYLDGLNVRLWVVNATGDRDRATAAAREFQKQGAQLLITLGTVPTLVGLDITRASRLPLVYSGVGTLAATGLEWAPKGAERRFTGTSIEVPVIEQLEVLRLAFPRIERLGILFCKTTPEAVATGTDMATAAQKVGLKVLEAMVSGDHPSLLERALSDLLDSGTEALFLPTDPVLASPKNLQMICERTSKARVPVMVPFESSVNHGAFMSFHADFVEVGRQAGRQAAQILSGVAPRLVPPETPKVKRLTLNLRVAQKLEIPLSRHLLSRAHYLY